MFNAQAEVTLMHFVLNTLFVISLKRKDKPKVPSWGWAHTPALTGWQSTRQEGIGFGVTGGDLCRQAGGGR